jgi:hypothetical protein
MNGFDPGHAEQEGIQVPMPLTMGWLLGLMGSQRAALQEINYVDVPR